MTDMNIPQGWHRVPIGDCIVERRKSLINVEDATGYGNYPFFTSGEAVLLHDKKQVEGENIYIADGGTANVIYFDGDAAYSNHTYVVGSKDGYSTKFLFYALKYLEDYINTNYFQGTGLKNLQKKDFKHHELIIPSSLEEQERIAKALTQIDDAIDSSSRLIAKYELVKKGLMHDLLTYGIDKYGNIRSERTHQFKDSPIGRIPVEWEIKKLSEIFSEIKSGTTPAREIKAYFEKGVHCWVKTLDLNEGGIFNTDERVSEYCLQATSLRLLPKDTVLVAMYGGWEQIGRTAILKVKACLNQAVSGLFSPTIQVNPNYILFYLQKNRLRWRKDAISTRKDPNITKKDVENFLVAIPSQVIKDCEQERIVNKIVQVDCAISTYKKECDSLISIRSGLLSDLITGKVRI